MLTFIVNPVAGNGYTMKIEPQLQAELTRRGLVCRFVHTDAPGHATQLAREAAQEEGCDGVIAVGGDGTSFEVACGLMNSGIPMGIIPAGTGNDFIKTVGIPRKPMDALDFLLTHSAHPVDVGGLNNRLFLNVCGTGFDVTVLDYTVAAKKICRGILPYLVGLIRGIVHSRPVHVRLTADGETQERDVLLCSIANGRFFGGGIPICPVAVPDDGLLDLIVIPHQPRWKIPLFLPSLLMGRVLRFSFTIHKRCTSVDLYAKGMRLNVDGEILNLDEAHFTVLQGTLSLFWSPNEQEV
ncbi:MAG: diacylglycerol kinase family lipid kinase [Clostridiales bacterium]|nr:diacylglycerol kinase family lipid kinase [Clostridiales bacterium]